MNEKEMSIPTVLKKSGSLQGEMIWGGTGKKPYPLKLQTSSMGASKSYIKGNYLPTRLARAVLKRANSQKEPFSKSARFEIVRAESTPAIYGGVIEL